MIDIHNNKSNGLGDYTEDSPDRLKVNTKDDENADIYLSPTSGKQKNKMADIVSQII